MSWQLALARDLGDVPDLWAGLVLKQLHGSTRTFEITICMDGEETKTEHPTMEGALAYGGEIIGRVLCPENADSRMEEWGDGIVTYRATTDRGGRFLGGARSFGDIPIIFLSLRDIESWDRAIEVGRAYAEVIRGMLATPDMFTVPR